ncbi:hypothetical protein [Lonepinella sp. MS14436]|uniref:hypothetical protein n=1 Tax=unclassified Lonepinella TaxID=2642006 RepID=UPI0036DD09AA
MKKLVLSLLLGLSSASSFALSDAEGLALYRNLAPKQLMAISVFGKEKNMTPVEFVNSLPQECNSYLKQLAENNVNKIGKGDLEKIIKGLQYDIGQSSSVSKDDVIDFNFFGERVDLLIAISKDKTGKYSNLSEYCVKKNQALKP